MEKMTREDAMNQMKDRFILACRILLNEGLIEGQYSISCRLDETKMLINDNVSPLLITRSNILTNAFGEEVKVGNVHPAIYKARPDVHAIVHAHPLHAIVLSTVDDAFMAVNNSGALFHDRIKVYKSHGQVKTKERAEEIAHLLGDGMAVLQRGHGTIVVGKSLEEAVLATIYLEDAAKVQFMAKSLGTPHSFSPEDAKETAKQVFKERSTKKAWDHYAAKVSGKMQGR